MKGCVFIGMSVDGYIAGTDDDLSWLMSRGEAAGDAGFTDFLGSVDALLMGRRTFEVVAGFDGPWHYGDTPVHVVSTTMAADAHPRLTAVHRSLDDAAAALTKLGRVYLDGGQLVQSALRAGLVDELTLSRVPVLIGRGVPLFGALEADVDLEHVGTRTLGGGMVQSRYRVRRAG